MHYLQRLDFYDCLHYFKESERQTLLRGEYYPGSESHQSAEKDAPAYQRFYFKTIGPLVSASVKYSEKKSIIGDDDDD